MALVVAGRIDLCARHLTASRQELEARSSER